MCVCVLETSRNTKHFLFNSELDMQTKLAFSVCTELTEETTGAYIYIYIYIYEIVVFLSLLREYPYCLEYSTMKRCHFKILIDF